MKNFKFLTLVCLLLVFSLNTFAQIASTVTFFSEDGHRFWVIIDGERKNPEPAHRVVVTDLTKDFYRAKIIFEDESFKDVNQNIQLVDVENQKMNVTYAIRNRKNNMVLRIVSFEAAGQAPAPITTQTPAQTPANSQPASQSTTNVSGQQQMPASQTQTITTTTDGINFGTNVKVDGEEIDMNINLSGMPGITTSITTTTTSSTTSTRSNNTQQQAVVNQSPTTASAPASTTCVRAVSKDQLQKGVNSINNASFAEDKMRIAKQFTKNNCLNVDQILSVMSLFSFEENKLDYAKYAYDFCVDKGNYFLVNDAFSFSSSKSALNKFLDSK